MTEDIVNKIEALLFASGKFISDENLGLIIGADLREIRKALKQLKESYDQRDHSLMLTQDDNTWKINVREKYLDLVRKIVADTELPKSVLETLAVIAWKSPSLQSDVVKIRSNKAYEHIAQLETMGFVIREKYGRSFRLKVTPKFLEYFDVQGDKNLKQLFKDIKEPQETEELTPAQQTLTGAPEQVAQIASIQTEEQQNQEALNNPQEEKDPMLAVREEIQKETETMQDFQATMEGDEDDFSEQMQQKKELPKPELQTTVIRKETEKELTPAATISNEVDDTKKIPDETTEQPEVQVRLEEVAPKKGKQTASQKDKKSSKKQAPPEKLLPIKKPEIKSIPSPKISSPNPIVSKPKTDPKTDVKSQEKIKIPKLRVTEPKKSVPVKNKPKKLIVHKNSKPAKKKK